MKSGGLLFLPLYLVLFQSDLIRLISDHDDDLRSSFDYHCAVLKHKYAVLFFVASQLYVVHG